MTRWAAWNTGESGCLPWPRSSSGPSAAGRPVEIQLLGEHAALATTLGGTGQLTVEGDLPYLGRFPPPTGRAPSRPPGGCPVPGAQPRPAPSSGRGSTGSVPGSAPSESTP